MRHLKEFNSFNLPSDRLNEEEGWKENILVGLMSLMGIAGMSQTTHKSDDGNKRFYKTKTEQTANNMIKRGWTLDSVQVDTLWKEVITKKPDTLVMVTRLSLDKDQYFASGKFELSQDVKDSISNTLNGISSENGVITDIRVESSTDKQGLSVNLQKQLKGMGYSGDNKGLSQARSEAVTKYMVELGINDSLIETSQKYEMGEQTIEQSARYVNVDIVYLVIDQEVTPSVKTSEPKVNKTYFLSIPKTGSTYTKTKTTYKFKGGNRKTIKMGPIKHHKSRKSVVDKCTW